MPTTLEYIGEPRIGNGITVSPGTTGGLADLIITRRAKVRPADLSSYLKQIIGAGSPEIDPIYTSPAAYLVSQRVDAKDKGDAILSRTFAMVPTSWDDYQDVDWLFPAFTGINTAGIDGIAASRSSSVYRTVAARVSHDYYFTTNPRTIVRPALFEPTDASNNRTSTLTTTTNPTGDEYEYNVASGAELVVRVSIKRYLGDIWERLTWRVPAS